MIKDQIDDLEAFLKELEKEAKRLQVILYEEMLEGIMDNFDIDKGFVISEKNYYTIAVVDKIVDKYSKKHERKILQEIADKILETIQINKEQFADLGVSKAILNRGATRAGIIEARLGLRNGNLVFGGWLDSLSQNMQIKEQLRTYVTDAITNETPINQFTKGLKTIVRGDKTATGIKERYFRQNVHDAIFQSDRFVKKQFAEAAGMKYFVYFGGVIKTTRDFCRARAGKVFSEEEAEAWRDMDWQGKSDPYEPLIDMGGYNCRHSPQYISDEEAEEMR